MTVEEAIKYVVKEVCEDCYGSDEPMGDCKTCGVKIAIECMEKQIPKKPIKDDTSYSGYKCPTCNSNIYQLRSHNIYRTPHCIFCGQKIDWEEGGTSD